jgi:hypothetical protein
LTGFLVPKIQFNLVNPVFCLRRPQRDERRKL